MGKRIIQQRRGRGTLTYRSPSHRFYGAAEHPVEAGVVTHLIHCPGHSAPLMEIRTLSGKVAHTVAPEGIGVGDQIKVATPGAGQGSVAEQGCVLSLRDIPEGTCIHNIELQPGDGGKLVRASGSFARIVAKEDMKVRVKLPSKKERFFHADCRAAIGVVAGAGRPEKPFLKAGTRYHRMRARNKLYPQVCGISMNAVDHPFGGKGSHTKGRPTQSPRGAPPGRKVGKIAPRRTGRRKL